LQIYLTPRGRDQHRFGAGFESLFLDQVLSIEPITFIGDDEFYFVFIGAKVVEI